MTADRQQRLASIIDRYVWAGGPHGCSDAAYRVLADSEIAAGLRAAPVLEQLEAKHKPRKWAADSDATTCTCGRGDCDVGELVARWRSAC